MQKNRLFLITGIIFLLLLVVSGYLVFQEPPEQGVPSEKDSEEGLPDKKLTDIYLNIYSLKGEKVMELKAEVGQVFEDRVELSTITGWYFARDQKWSFKAPKARWQSNEGLLTVPEDYLFWRDDLTIAGKELLWDRKKEQLEGREGVLIKGDSYNLKGRSFQAPSSLDSIVVFGRPASLDSSSENDITITSPEIEIKL